MVVSLIDNTLVMSHAEKNKVVLIEYGGKTNIVNLNQLSEADLKKLKTDAYKNLLDVNAVPDQIYEFVRRINAVLDNRANNAACLTIQAPQEAREKEMMREAMSSTRCLGICLIIMIGIIVGCIAYFVS